MVAGSHLRRRLHLATRRYLPRPQQRADRRRLSIQPPSQSQRSGRVVCLCLFKSYDARRAPSAGLGAGTDDVGLARPTQLARTTSPRCGRRDPHGRGRRTGRTTDRRRARRADRGRDRRLVSRAVGLRTSDPLRDAAAARNRCHDPAGVSVLGPTFRPPGRRPWPHVWVAGADPLRADLGPRRRGGTPHLGREAHRVASAHRLAGVGHALCRRGRDSVDHLQPGAIRASGSALEQLRVGRWAGQLRHHLLRSLHRCLLGTVPASGVWEGPVRTKMQTRSTRG